MTSVWDWIFLSVKRCLQGLVELGGDNPCWNIRSRSPAAAHSKTLAPTEKEGQVLRNIPSPNIFAQQIQSPALSSTTPPYSRGASNPTSSAHTEGQEKPTQDKGRRGKPGQLPPSPCRPTQSQGFTSPGLNPALISPGSSLDLSFPCASSLINPLST